MGSFSPSLPAGPAERDVVRKDAPGPGLRGPDPQGRQRSRWPRGRDREVDRGPSRDSRGSGLGRRQGRHREVVHPLAKAVTDLLDAPPEGTLILAFRFKIGNERCSREAFLRFSLERLDGWDGLEPVEKEADPEKVKPLVRQALSVIGAMAMSTPRSNESPITQAAPA